MPSEAARPESPGAEPGTDELPGRGIIRAAWLANLMFAVAAVPAVAGVEAFEGVALAVSLVLFAISLGVWVSAFAIAVGRSARGDDVVVASLFLMQGPVPKSVRRQLVGAFAVCLVVTGVTVSANPFGTLVPMLPVGLAGLWGARHGTFPARRDPAARDPRRRV